MDLQCYSSATFSATFVAVCLASSAGRRLAVRNRLFLPAFQPGLQVCTFFRAPFIGRRRRADLQTFASVNPAIAFVDR